MSTSNGMETYSTYNLGFCKRVKTGLVEYPKNIYIFVENNCSKICRIQQLIVTSHRVRNHTVSVGSHALGANGARGPSSKATSWEQTTRKLGAAKRRVKHIGQRIKHKGGGI